MVLVAVFADVVGIGARGFGWKRTGLLGVGALVALAGLAVLAGLGRRADGRAAVDPAGPCARAALAATGVLVAGLALWSRLSGLDAGLWHDEVYSIRHYTALGPGRILGRPYIPNDHGLFNLLNWATANVLGHADAVYRIWSTIPALAALAVVAWWVRRRLGAGTAVIAGVLLVTSPLHLALARQARGYGLAFLAQSLLLVTADAVARRPGRRQSVAFGASALVGIWTLPVCVLSFLGASAALARVRARWRTTAAVVAAVGLASLVFYARVLPELWSASGQQFGQRLPWHGIVSGSIDHLGTPTGRLLAQAAAWPDGEPTLAASGSVVAIRLALGVLAAAGALVLWRRRERDLALLLALPIVLTYTTLTVGRLYVEPRFGSYLLMPYIVLVAVATVAALDALRARPGLWWPAAGLVAVACAFAGVRLVAHTAYENRSPIENFKGAAALVRRTGIGSAITNDARLEGLPYYLGLVREVPLSTNDLVRSFCSAPPPLVYVDAPFGAVEPPRDCLVRRRASVRRFPQRERGGHIDVWILR